MNLQEIVPWGRSFTEYRQMFGLNRADLERSILGWGDGPASFNAELTRRGGTVVSVDPLYAHGGAEIQRRIAETALRVIAEVRRHARDFVWEAMVDPDRLFDVRMGAMNQFLADYDAGRRDGRYRCGALPDVPELGRPVDLVLCSHLLFTYSAQLDGTFHGAAINAMLRTAPELRIFPLVALDGAPSPHVDPVLSMLRAGGHLATVERVPYEFQRGANQMLRVVRGGKAGV
jgi:hypothetical protein